MIDRAVVDSHRTMLDGKKKLDDQIEMLTIAGMSVPLISRILRHTRWGHCVLVRQHCCD
jgi:tRNA A22 N-methylase